MMKTHKYYYLYKITNKINGHYYYGVHSTDNLDDGYMGSGTRLRNAYKKYGIENFEKVILGFYKTLDEVMCAEHDIVTIDEVKNQNCYNLVIGGWGAHHENQRSTPWYKGMKMPQSLIEKSVQAKAENGFYKKLSIQNKGYKNFDFQTRWKDLYEKDMHTIAKMILYTNIPDSVIINIFKNNLKYFRVIKYYDALGILGTFISSRNVSYYFLEKNEVGYYKAPPMKKRFYTETVINTYYWAYIKEYFDLIEDIKKFFENDNFTLSMIQNQVTNEFGNTTKFLAAIQYFKEIGVLQYEKTIDAFCEFPRKSSKEIIKRHSKKDVYKFNFDVNIILFDKEHNYYEVNNGKPIQKGKLISLFES